MKTLSRILTIAAIQVSVLFAFVPGAFAIETTPTPIYADEFSAFDSSVWTKTTPWGAKSNPGANELQYYDPANTFTQDGVLRFRTESRSMNGYDYTSGIISSLNRPKFQYGYFEMRGKLPKGQGYWPAFWLTDDRDCEIDIFEVLGHEPDRLHLTMHHTHDGYHHDHGISVQGPDYSQGFHTYAVDWQPTYIKWYVDGQEVRSYTDHIPSDPMWIVANTALGGWAGAPDSTTPFPQSFDVDYIRVWRNVADARAAAPDAYDNVAPVTAPDSYATTVGTRLTVPPSGVLRNDTDGNGQTLTASTVTPPRHGSMNLLADGSFTYAPDPGFSGIDGFTYVATDGQASSPPAAVTINVKSDRPRVRNGSRKRLVVSGAVPMTTQAVTVVIQVQRKIHGHWHQTRVVAKRDVKTGRYELRTKRLKKGYYRVRTKYYGPGTTKQATRWVKIRKK